MSEQSKFDELTTAIASHNLVVAETIVQAQESLVIAKDQLHRAEASFENLKKYIVDIVVKT